MNGSDPPPETAAFQSARSRTVLLIVFVTILIDFIGFTVLIPVLPLYAERLGASNFQIGLILTVYAIAQLLFLPVWGWVSDRIGRRPVILVSLFGTVGAFLVLAVAETLAVIYLARVLAGFFAASIGTAQAVVTDVTRPEERAGGMGIIGAAFGAGMVLGPALGGVAAAFHPQAPFYFVAAMAGVNAVLAWFYLPESRPEGLRKPDMQELGASFVPAPLRLLWAVHERRIALYLYLFFHLFTAFAVLEALFPVYAADVFGKNELDIGILFGWIGVVLFITQGLLLRALVEWAGEQRLVWVGMLAMGLGLVTIAWAPSFGWCYVVGTLIAFGNSICFPAFTSLYSKACEAANAGELMGQSQAMATTGRIVGPMLGGLLMDHWAPETPFLIAAAMMLAAILLFRMFRSVLLRELSPPTAQNTSIPG